MAGNAALTAARKMKEQLFEAVAEQLKVPCERLDAAGGVIYDDADPGHSISFVKAIQMAEARFGALISSGSYAPPEGIHGDYKGAGVGPSPAYSYSTCVAQVTVDIETGEIVVEKLWLAHDVGQSINPLLVAGQVEGGAYMGYGEAVMEQQIFRKGRHKIPSLLDYKLPATVDTPEIETILVEVPDLEGPFGAKEAGQGPLNPVIPAITNAVFDAVGVRIDEVPITPDKVLKALKASVPGKVAPAHPQIAPIETPSPWPTRLIRWKPQNDSVQNGQNEQVSNGYRKIVHSPTPTKEGII
jgi:4-hydroxybenzoyl-CoA reductase subunit alpha